jgi:hypothetical protein
MIMEGPDRGVGPGAGQQEAPVGRGFAPGLGYMLSKFLTTRPAGSGKKQAGRTPLEPKRQPQHHLNRWRDEGRQALVLEALRLDVLPDTARPPIGRGGYYRTWKALAVAVESARKARES